MRRRVIIFEDHALIRHNLWHYFDGRGYEVFTFPEPHLCPLHAVQACPCPGETRCADLIISDLNMWGKNGIDCIESLMEKGCKLRHFALMSGYFSDAHLERASIIGCALFTKPFSLEAFAAWVQQVETEVPPGRVLHDWLQISPD